MAKKHKKKTWNVPMVSFFIILITFIFLFIVFAYLSLSPVIFGIDMDEFAENRNTVYKTLTASRGTIYDNSDNILALNVSSYTVIAYLEKASESLGDNYVKDLEATAEALSPLIDMEVETLVNLMSSDKYQVELGPGGRGITELLKEDIESLNLDGIDFIETQKRFYPNGDFASYIIGYAKENEVETTDDSNNTITVDKIVGELGIESKYNDLLSGTDGYLIYQQDKYGYKIGDTGEERVEAIQGYDVYLTIDASIQRFIEDSIQDTQDIYDPEWITISALDAKTGDVLGSSSTPSFDPNVLDITNYENPLVSQPYEPGSTMKIYTYMCALENGVYDGGETYQSGTFTVVDDVIKDWNKVGWGTISFDVGFAYSSNVGIANLISRHLTKEQLKECYLEYGFGEPTGIELSREMSGNISFNYEVEVLTAGFGQGITTTPIQQLQALTLLSNDGKMLQPHIVSKIVNNNTDEIYYEREIEESEQLISGSTVQKMKSLMNDVVNSDFGSGQKYSVEGVDLIGKTGTAQIYSQTYNTYLSGSNSYIFSFSGMFPYEDPEVIIYGAMKLPKYGSNTGLATAIKSITESIAKYYNMEETINETVTTYEIDSYISKNTEEVVNTLTSNLINPIILGDGNIIIKQSISSGSTLVQNDRILLLTNANVTMPSVIGYSRSEIIALCDLLNIDYEIEDYGYVIEQSIAIGNLIEDQTLLVKMEDKIEEEEYEEE